MEGALAGVNEGGDELSEEKPTFTAGEDGVIKIHTPFKQFVAYVFTCKGIYHRMLG